MTRIALTLTLIVGLARLGSAQTTPSGPVSSNVRQPVITSYPINGGILLAADGTVGSPGITFAADPDTGFYRTGANSFCFVTGGGALLCGSANLTVQTGVNLLWATDNGTDIGATGASRPAKLHLGNPAATAPTDSTAVESGDVTRLRSSSTITPATAGVGNCGAAFQAAALTADCTIATLPAGMKLLAIYADVTAGFTCSGTCTGTKVFQCGTAVNGTQVFAASLNVAATGQFGLADADLGSGMTRAAAIQGGLIGSWTATTPISCRFTSGTGNWGSGAATFVNAGSIKYTLITEQVK